MNESSRASRHTSDSSERAKDDDSYKEDRSSGDYYYQDNGSEDDDDEFDEFPFTNAGDTELVPTSAPTLEEMASLSAAIGLWNHAKDLLPKSVKFGEERTLKKQISEWTNQLPLPKSFAKCIGTHLYAIVVKIEQWIYYHRQNIFLGKNRNDLHGYKHYIVWNPNPTINYYLTALNLLKSDELSDLEKYRLCCTYCLKEEIEKRRQTLVGNEVLNDKKISSRHPLVVYWNYYFAGELHRMKTRRYLPIDEFMIRQVDNWPAIEYFFDRLNAEKQVASAICIIDLVVPRYQKLILMKLNECQRQQVYAERAALIIRNYAAYNGDGIYASNAISTWYEVRDLMNHDQFVSLMKELCFDYATDDVLMEIWTSAYIELKLHVSTLSNYDFIGDVLKWAAHKNSNGFDFLFAVLKDGAKMKVSTNKGEKFFYELCRNMISNCELESLAELLNLCVPNAKQCAEFKLLLAEKSYTNDCCKKLIEEHEFSKVEQFLKFFNLENIPKSRQIVRDLLLENLKHIDDYCLSFYADGNVEALNAALAPLQSSYSEVILEYKRYLLFSEEGLEACLQSLQFNDRYFDRNRH